MEDKSSSTLRAFTVFVDAEGNDKWIADGVFVDKPKLKTEVALAIPRRYCLDQIEDIIGLNKDNVLISYIESKVHSQSQESIMVIYFEGNIKRRKSILVTDN